MNNSPLTLPSPPAMDLRIFEATPGIRVILLPDAPHFTMVAVSNDFLLGSGMKREDVIGKSHFEVFPQSPADSDFTGHQSLRDSFQWIMEHKRPHEIPVQRYDIPDGEGGFTEKYWHISNGPVLNELGIVQYIVHGALDITEKVEALRQQETYKGFEKAYNHIKESVDEGKWFKFMADHAQDPFILMKEDGSFPYLNKKALEAWGYTEAEVSALRVPDVDPLFDEQRFREIFAKAQNETLDVFETLHKRKDGTIYPVEIKMGALLMDGQPHLFAIARDITERKKTEESLIEGEQKLRALVASAPFPIATYIGKEMRIELANPSIIDVWGKGSDVIGKLFSEILPELENQEILSQLAGVYNSGLPYHARNQRVDLLIDGKMRPFFFNYSFTPLFDASGKVYGVMNTAADVTDLNMAKLKVEQSEKNFRNMILEAPMAMCILLGEEHVVDIANDAVIELWGRSREDVMHKPIFTGLPDVREQGLEQLLSEVYHTGITFKANEHPVNLLRNGKQETLYLNFAYEPHKDSDGTILGILVIAIDVTEQVLSRQKIEEVVKQRTHELAAANDALLLSNADLKRSNTNLEEFAYAASHDMKEPIRKIFFFANRLKETLAGKLTTEEQRYFERLETGAKRMGTLIDDLLLYSHISRGASVGELVDLNDVLTMVTDDQELGIEEKQAQINIGTLPVINGHRRQLQQLFDNLLGNALKYSKPGVPPVVNIHSRPVPGKDTPLKLAGEAGDRIYHLVEVSDNGIGFDQTDSERIFNVFTRLHGNVEYKGTGVGLSIVRKVVQNHQGFVIAEGVLGKGACFTILLPAIN